MEVREFVRNLGRMCKFYGGVCNSGIEGGDKKKCPLNDYNCHVIRDMEDEVFDIVENWTKEHPAKTRQSELLKYYPHAKMWEDESFIGICPKQLCDIYQCGAKRSQTCYDCCKEYWKEVVE